MLLFKKVKRQNGCEKCFSWCEKTLVSNPKKLSSLIAKVKDAEKSEILKNLPPKEGSYEEEFKFISIQGPWNDIVLCQFACTSCDKRFELCADTYHGGRNNGWHPK